MTVHLICWCGEVVVTFFKCNKYLNCLVFIYKIKYLYYLWDYDTFEWKKKLIGKRETILYIYFTNSLTEMLNCGRNYVTNNMHASLKIIKNKYLYYLIFKLRPFALFNLLKNFTNFNHRFGNLLGTIKRLLPKDRRVLLLYVISLVNFF
jgi:hypothetical protein